MHILGNKLSFILFLTKKFAEAKTYHSKTFECFRILVCPNRSETLYNYMLCQSVGYESSISLYTQYVTNLSLS